MSKPPKKPPCKPDPKPVEPPVQTNDSGNGPKRPPDPNNPGDGEG